MLDILTEIFLRMQQVLLCERSILRHMPSKGDHNACSFFEIRLNVEAFCWRIEGFLAAI